MKILAEPIEAAVWFGTKGRPHPVKFRYSDPSGLSHTVTVDRVISMEETRIAGIRALLYLCQSQVGEELKRYELKYLVEECRWQLYKM